MRFVCLNWWFDEKICQFSLANSNHSFEVGFHYCFYALFINMHQKERLDVKRANKKRKINKKCSVVECKDYREELDYLKKQSFILSSIDGKVWKRKWRWSAYVYEIGVIIKGLKERLCLLWFRSKSNYCFLKVLQRSWELKKWKIDERLHPCHVLKGNDGRYSRLKSFAKINITTKEGLWVVLSENHHLLICPKWGGWWRS